MGKAAGGRQREEVLETGHGSMYIQTDNMRYKLIYLRHNGPVGSGTKLL